MADTEQLRRWDAKLLPDANLTGVIQAVKRYLVVQPKLDALSTAQAALLPLLYASGHEIWQPNILRIEGLASSSHVRYKLNFNNAFIIFDIWEVGKSLDRSPARDMFPDGPVWGIRSNGSEWQLFDFTKGDPYFISLSLFEENAPKVFNALLTTRKNYDLATRLTRAQSLLSAQVMSEKLVTLIKEIGLDEVRDQIGGDPNKLVALMEDKGLISSEENVLLDNNEVRKILDYQLNATELGLVRSAPQMGHITLEDVQRHSQSVRNLKGHLKAQFDGQTVEIYSRSAFYYVLAALAIQYGREDIIPVAHLIRPPEQPPSSGRSRPLGKPGWFLSFEQDADTIEMAVSALIHGLNLGNRFVGSQRGQSFPSK